LRDLIIFAVIVALLVVGGFVVKGHIDRLERDLTAVRADLNQATAQGKLNAGAASAERNLAVRERTIIKEVDRGRADLEAASSLGRDAVLMAWADAARRLRGEPAAVSADPGAAPLGP
jgi:hypothetical protein